MTQGPRSAACVVGLARLELATSPLSGVRSNHLSYRPEQGGVGSRARSPLRAITRTAPMLAFQRTKHQSLKTEPETCRNDGLDRASLHHCWLWVLLLRKEVIQPQVPLRLPCYDFTPVIDHSLGTCLPCGLARPLLEQSTPMV